MTAPTLHLDADRDTFAAELAAVAEHEARLAASAWVRLAVWRDLRIDEETREARRRPGRDPFDSGTAAAQPAGSPEGAWKGGLEG